MDTETKTYKLSELYPDVAAKAAQRLHIKKDEIPLVRKYFVSDKDSVNVDEKERSVVSRISCVNVDRDGDSLLPSGVMLDNYKRNPIVCWSHSYNSPEQIIGKNIWIKSDDQGLVAKTAFANNEFADQVYRAYTEDVGGTGPLLRGWSVGFIPLEYETPTKQAKDGPKRIYTKWELLEYSAVAVPCSPESLTMAYEKGIITSETLRQDLGLVPISVPAPVPGTHTTVCEQDTVNKIVDAENNPSIYDIFTAIGYALNPQPEQPAEPGTPAKPWYAVQDVFPVDFPNGHCVFTEYLPGRDINPSYRQNYTFSDGRATLIGERVEVVVAYREKSAEVVTKPETTADYHRIPVSDGHGDHEIRTITVSAKDGIKALYCVTCKEIATYLFDVDKFTMAEAEAWVEEHKKDAVVPEIKQAPVPAPPDLSAEMASLRQDVAAILARLQVTPEPAPTPAPAPVEDIAFEPEPDIVIEPSAPDKTAEVLIDEYIRSADYKKAVAEAIEVALAKVRGRVI